MRKKWMIAGALLLAAAALCLLLKAGKSENEETRPTEETTPTVASVQPGQLYQPRSVGNYYITTPVGFVVMPGAEELLRLESLDSGDDSRVTVELLEIDGDIRELTQDWLPRQAGREADSLAVSESHQVYLMGCFGCYARFTQQRGDVTEQVWALALQTAEGVYLFTFADATPDGAWEESFLEAARSIRLLEPGEYIQIKPQGLETYTLSCGLTLQAEPGLRDVTGGGYGAILQGDYCLILVLEDPKQDATADLTLEEYAQSVARIHELDEFRENAYGNLTAAYMTHSDATGLDYFYYLTVKETEGSFYLCQMVCLADEYAAYREQFDIWATTVAAAQE